MRATLVSLIKLYQYLLSPWVGSHCRFYPTCSEYAKAAIETHGVVRGSWFAGQASAALPPVAPGRS